MSAVVTALFPERAKNHDVFSGRFRFLDSKYRKRNEKLRKSVFSAPFESFLLVRYFCPQISQPISWKGVHTLPSMDTFSRYFVQKVEEKLSILSKVWTYVLRQNASARDVWTSFMLTYVNSWPYNSRFVVNFTVICQIYVRKIKICSHKFTTRTFTAFISLLSKKLDGSIL